MSSTTTVVGNVVHDIDLKYTNAGKAFASVTVAVNERRKDPRTGETVDGEAWFARGTVWGEFAENVASTISKGMRVVGHAKIKQRSYETKEGEKRTTIELDFEALGPDLRWASANVTRTQRQGGAGAPAMHGAGDWPSGGGFGAPVAAQSDWATSAAPANTQVDGWENEPGF